MSAARTAPGGFEARYRDHADPWGFASSAYEREKYARTVAALGDRRFPAALELGCSIGVLTALLAERCDHLVALDGAPTAVAAARERLGDRTGIDVREGLVPEDLPAGPWDLVVASEVLYYLGHELLDATVRALAASLSPGGLLLAVHWTGTAASHHMHADEVHARLLAEPGLRGRHAELAAGYRLDVLERAG